MPSSACSASTCTAFSSTQLHLCEGLDALLQRSLPRMRCIFEATCPCDSELQWCMWRRVGRCGSVKSAAGTSRRERTTAASAGAASCVWCASTAARFASVTWSCTSFCGGVTDPPADAPLPRNLPISCLLITSGRKAMSVLDGLPWVTLPRRVRRRPSCGVQRIPAILIASLACRGV